MAAVAELPPHSGSISAACSALGLARASFHRYKRAQNQPLNLALAPSRPKPARALSEAEHQNVLNVLRGHEFADAAPAEIYATLLDQGTYLCSIRTMYRVLSAHDQVRERRRHLRHPTYEKPELLAHGPNYVRPQSGLELGYHQAERPEKVELLLSLCHH